MADEPDDVRVALDRCARRLLVDRRLPDQAQQSLRLVADLREEGLAVGGHFGSSRSPLAESKRCASFGRGLSETRSPRPGTSRAFVRATSFSSSPPISATQNTYASRAELLDDLDAGRHAVLPDLERFRAQAEDEVAAPVRACDSGERIVDRDARSRRARSRRSSRAAPGRGSSSGSR